MINLNSSRIELSQPMPISETVASIMEGVVLVTALESGRAVVKPSTGSGSEIVAGFARSQFMNPTDSPKIETVTIPVGGVVTLGKYPNAASGAAMGVTIDGVAATCDSGVPSAAGMK